MVEKQVKKAINTAAKTTTKPKAAKVVKTKGDKGIASEKDEFSEWFTQLMLKADLADYTNVSGAIVFKPTAYAIWENIKQEVDKRFKKIGLKNVYFPLLIPEKTLAKEQEHFKGFVPEVAWVTHAGSSKLSERLAIRPTSETIMYESYSKWIRSWRDLPLRLNQWNNVIRWEFKHPIPFLRTREFLWNEGHTVFASAKEAIAEEKEIMTIYKNVCENLLALPSLIGKKTDKEKFAGAVYTTSLEFLMPNGKAIQGPDFHHDGQNFSKAYDIRFLDKQGKEQYAWQNTFAITTRMLGVTFAIHSDNKGLILPPKISPNKIAIIPILFEESKKQVLAKANEIQKKLKKYSPILDDREEYKPGFKYNEWELKGIPLRIELGPKDLEKAQVIAVRRDTNEKIIVKLENLTKEVDNILDQIQENLWQKANALITHSLVQVETLDAAQKEIKNKKIVVAPMCNKAECEDNLKWKTQGAKALNIPSKAEQPASLAKAKCIICSAPAAYYVRIGKSY